MLGEFIRAHRDELIAHTRLKVTARDAPTASDDELQSGVPLFIDQLVARLRDQIPHSFADDDARIGVSATSHGGDMLRRGFTIAHVVQGYGDVCQAVTELAIATHAPITTEEFRTLNHCLDVATAEAVREYERQRDGKMLDKETERLGVLAHELRNLVSSAVLSFEILKRGSVGVGGSTGAVLGRSLLRIRDVIDRALAEVRLEAGITQRERIPVAGFLDEVEVVASFEASEKNVRLKVVHGERGASVAIDRHIFGSVVGNLLQNAIKFTHQGGLVTVTSRCTATHVSIDVGDECGGLPTAGIDELFLPFQQRSKDRSGLGLGLTIARQGVETVGGAIRVRDIPGHGCVFTVELPRVS